MKLQAGAFCYVPVIQNPLGVFGGDLRHVPLSRKKQTQNDRGASRLCASAMGSGRARPSHKKAAAEELVRQ